MKNLHQSNNFYRIFSLAKTVRSLGKPFYIIANQWRNITYRLRTFFYTKNWYDNKLVTHLFLIFFFPIGLYALWKSHTITKWWKISASLLLAFLLTSIGFRTLVEDDSLMHFKSIEEMSYLNLTQAQKDSVDSVRKIEAEKRQRAKEERDNIIKKLKKIAESDWPNAYRIQEFWVKEQIEAYEYMLKIKDDALKIQAQRDWPLDFSTQKFWYDEQIRVRDRLR